MPDENEQPKERNTLDDRAGVPALVHGLVNNYRRDVDGMPAKDSFSL
jgi:hypothetical protein